MHRSSIEPVFVQISPCASHPDLCEGGYHTFYRLVANERVQGHELAAIAWEHLGARSVGIVHEDDAFGSVVAEYFAEGFDTWAASSANRLPSAPSTLDVSEVVGRMSDLDVDLFVFAVHAHEGGLISAAARDAGASPAVPRDRRDEDVVLPRWR